MLASINYFDEEAATTDTLTDARIRPAARQVVRSLFAVKGWVREAGRSAETERSTTSLLALALLERHGPARVGEIAEAARVDASVVSRQLHHLERDGLVGRTADPHDRRAQLVSLTEEGRRELARGRRHLEDVVADRLAHWEPDELTAFATTLDRLLGDLARTS